MCMGIEIDFVAVGRNSSKAGDAIAIRCGNLFGARHEQFVFTIDGGTRESGRDLANHVRHIYGTDSVDVAVSSHPDQDHISGMSVLLDDLRVGTLLMHRPWQHSDQIARLFATNPNASTVTRNLRRDLALARDLENQAKRKGITIIEPFASEPIGFGSGRLTFLGPSREMYLGLVPLFDKTPEPSPLALALGLPSRSTSIVRSEPRLCFESAERPLLHDGTDDSAAENNSSTILLFETDDHRALFTGDAGKVALEAAWWHAISHGIHLGTLDFLQVPHHGSRRNVNPRILNSIQARTAYISTPGHPTLKHPSQMVINYLNTKGTRVFCTNGFSLWHQHNAPRRDGWARATPSEFQCLYFA